MKRFTLILIVSLTMSELFGATFTMRIPAELVNAKGLTLVDESNFQDMEIAIDRQLVAFEKNPLNGFLRIGKNTFSMKVYKETLVAFKSLITTYKECLAGSTSGEQTELGLECVIAFDNSLKKDFYVYKAIDVKSARNLKKLQAPPLTQATGSGPSTFTAYFSPSLEVSTTKEGDFQYAIYARPTDAKLATSFNRNQILFDNKLEGSELYFIKDPFELYLMQVEGGGVALLNGQKQFISYDGSNGMKHTFLSKYMVSKGYIERPTVSAQRTFMQENPDKWKEVYEQNPNFVYFKNSEDEPVGMENIPLTSNRSGAFDRSIFKRKGLLAFVSGKRPIKGDTAFADFNRFIIDQDTGGAIKGTARVDLYVGYGEAADYEGHNLYSRGDMYYFIKK